MEFLKYKDFIVESTYNEEVANEEANKYQTFFKGKLAQWKISSPSELSDEDKEKFFKEIKDEWKD
jgi:hypothetical protein